MTEFEAAYYFVIRHAESVSAAYGARRLPDDRAEFEHYCGIRGIEPTHERLSLARDIGAATLAYTPVEGVGRGVAGEVPVAYLSDRLECHGWRVDFLNQDVWARPG